MGDISKNMDDITNTKNVKSMRDKTKNIGEITLNVGDSINI